MFFLSTGMHPFKHDESLNKVFDFKQDLFYYSECNDFADMLDLISSLLVANPDQRLTSGQAVGHPWLQEPQHQSK